MSFTESGYTKDTVDIIVARLVQKMRDVFPSINLDPSNLLYQWMKIVGLETLYQENIIEASVANMTVMGASGVFLDYHANEAGLFRKQAEYATGYVQATCDPDGTTIPAGTLFSTANGKNYESTEDVVLTQVVTMYHSGTIKDILPRQYNSIVPDGTYSDPWWTGGIYYENGIPITQEYSVDGNVLTWNGAPSLQNKQLYRIALVAPLVVNVPIRSASPGVDYNTGQNTITINTENLVNIGSVNNESDLIDGTDEEDDEDLRYRIISGRKKHFTLERIRDMVMQVHGVADCRVYQNTSSDRSSVADWSDVQTYADSYSEILDSPDKMLAFTFYPSGEVGTMQELVMYARTGSTDVQNPGTAPPLKVYMTVHIPGSFSNPGDIHDVDLTVDRGVLIKGGEHEWQELRIPIKYVGLDRTKTYKIYLWCEDADANNYWEFAVHTEADNSDWRLANYTIAYSDPDWVETVFANTTRGIIFKTMYGLPAFTVSVVPDNGVNFADQIYAEIVAMLDYIDGGGYAPVCIQSVVKEATKIYLDVTVTVSIEDNYSLADVTDDIKNSITEYLQSLHPGDDIVYSQVEKAILLTNGVYRDRQLKIRLTGDSGSTEFVTNLTEIDLPVGDDEYVRLGTVSIDGA